MNFWLLLFLLFVVILIASIFVIIAKKIKGEKLNNLQIYIALIALICSVLVPLIQSFQPVTITQEGNSLETEAQGYSNPKPTISSSDTETILPAETVTEIETYITEIPPTTEIEPTEFEYISESNTVNPKTIVQTFNGFVDSDRERCNFEFTVNKSQDFYFKLSDYNASLSADIMVFDSNDYLVSAITSEDNNIKAKAYLEENKTYTLQVYRWTGESEFKLCMYTY